MNKDQLFITLEIINQSLQSIRENRLRTTLSILGVTIGIMAVIIVGTISQGGSKVIFSELQTFGLKSLWIFRDHNDDDPNKATRIGTGINNYDLNIIENGCCRSISLITPIVNSSKLSPYINKNGNFSKSAISGVGINYLRINNDKLTSGRNFRKDDITKNRNLIIIGSEIKQKLFPNQASVLGSTLRIESRKFTIIGIIKNKSRDFLSSIGSNSEEDINSRILIPYTTFQSMLGLKKEISLLQAESVSIENAKKAATEITNILDRHHSNKFKYRSETMAQYIETANHILRGVSVIGIIAASVSLIVGGMGIMNIMTTSVIERTREIGLRKAVGAQENHILYQFIIESIFISSIGGFLGLIIGLLGSFLIAILASFPLTPSWEMIVIALVTSIFVGVISGYYPAMRAAKMQPVTALRYD